MAPKRDIYHRRRRKPAPRNPLLAGTPLPANVGVASRYARELDTLTRTMADATRKAVTSLAAEASAPFLLSAQGQMAMGGLERHFVRLFEAKARDMATDMLARANKASAASLGVSLNALAAEAGKARRAVPAGQDTDAERNLKELARRVTLHADVSPDLRAGLEAAVEENVKLIHSIPAQYYGNIQKAVADSVTDGRGLHDLIPRIERIGGVTRERARFIAVDQTKKANAFISAQKMKEAGIRRFRWRHSGGSEVPRVFHAANWPNGLNGGVFEIDNPPVIDPGTGERGLPGQLINCRCSMEPVLEFEEVDHAE